MRVVVYLISLTTTNFIIEVIFSHDWSTALDRSVCEILAVIGYVYIKSTIDKPKSNV